MNPGGDRSRSARCASPVSLLASLLGPFFCLLLLESLAGATCSVDRTPSGPGAPLTVHLGTDCSRQDREAQAVPAGDLLAALTEGRGVDLVGVVVTGDLLMDHLPLQPVGALSPVSLPIQEAIQRHGLKEVRVVAGPIAIRDSVVKGRIVTRIKDGLVIMNGPVTMTGTTFERSVDFSLAAFAAPVDFAQAILLGEGFFTQALFTQAARFEKTAFGPHSRFHRARFFEPVTFHRAGFNGLAEFIEVTFDKEASFAQTYFKMGTGFSGARFRGTLDFSEAVFEREAFFMFTVFERDAYFRRTTFRGEANFSDAEFKGLDDFSKVFFNVEPRFTRAKISGTPARPGGMQDPRVLYIIAAALLAFTLVFVFILRKG